MYPLLLNLTIHKLLSHAATPTESDNPYKSLSPTLTPFLHILPAALREVKGVARPVAESAEAPAPV